MTKDLVSQVKKEIEQEKIAHQKALIRKMFSLIEAKEKEITDKKAELVALKEELGGLKEDLKNGDYSEAEPREYIWGEWTWEETTVDDGTTRRERLYQPRSAAFWYAIPHRVSVQS